MDIAELFAHAVASLPEAVRHRIDGDPPLDWGALEDSATGVAIAEAARGDRRLPEPAETLAAGLVREVGIVPADLAAGRERECAANAWLRQIAVEPDGERYRLRSRRTGELHGGARAEALAGYVLLALDLATLVHRAAESWIEAGDRYPAAADDRPAPLARCAIRVGARLKTLAGPDRGRTGRLARILEDAWNAQSAELREELATASPPIAAPGASAPGRRHYAPADSYRVEAFDPAELRWLCALGQRALEQAPPEEREDAPRRPDPQTGSPAPDTSAGDSASGSGDMPAPDATGAIPAAASSDPEELALGRELAELQSAAERLPAARGPGHATRLAPAWGDDVAALEMTALEAQVQAETTVTLDLATRPDGIAADEALAGFGRAAARLAAPVRRRLGDAYGIGVAQTLARLRDPGEADTASGELRAAIAARRAPAWLEELASSLLADAGAQARDGTRTGSMSVDFAHRPEGFLATDAETGFQGRLTLPGLLEQLHLALTFAEHASTALEALRTAGTEGGWTLGETLNGTSGLAATEQEMLEAARQIEHALGRSRHASLRTGRPPSALEQAAIAAEAIGTVGPTVRAAAGWPGAAEAPNPRDPGDVARMAAFAETLRESVRSISNRQIAGGISAAHGVSPETKELS